MHAHGMRRPGLHLSRSELSAGAPSLRATDATTAAAKRTTPWCAPSWLAGIACDSGSKTYYPGNTLTAGDGCNQCSCTDYGEVSCTLGLCDPTCTYWRRADHAR